jgi:hypothetical protein
VFKEKAVAKVEEQASVELCIEYQISQNIISPVRRDSFSLQYVQKELL